MSGLDRRPIAYAIIASFLVAVLIGAGLYVLWPRPPPARPQVPDIYLYMNDLADPGALSPDEEATIDDLCYQIDDLYTAEVAVLVVNDTQPLDMNRFAFEVFDQNGIGKKGYDNGVLLVVAVDTLEWRVEVGYGLEGVLPDAKVGRIAEEWLEPYLASGDLGTGLYETVLSLGIEIEDNYTPVPVEHPPEPLRLDWWPIVLPILVFFLLASVSKGRILLMLPLRIVFRRGGFSGGRSGGGGAGGRT